MDSGGKEWLFEFLKDNIKYHGGFSTLTGTAMRHVYEVEFQQDSGDRPDAPNIMIVLTDGKAKDKGQNKVKVVGEMLRKTDLMVIAVGIKKAKHAELVQMATNEDFVHETNSFSGLQQLLPDLFDEICTSEAIGGETIHLTTTTLPPPTTPRKVKLPKAMQELNCLAKDAYVCDIKMDLAIVLDAYHKLPPQYNAWQKYFAKKMITQFKMGSESARITVNPMSRNKQSMSMKFSDPVASSEKRLCPFTTKLRPSKGGL